jgi:bacillithiol biosynthesis cysteine-adding enzyme BshC
LAAFPTSITFQDTGYFSDMMCDYLERSPKISEFYNNFPDFEGFGKQLEEKAANYPKDFRGVLSQALNAQYEGVDQSELTANNIELLKDPNTFTVTTGHQLNLFTGPLYFLYKIASVINLSTQLKKRFPESNFVPIYWMASEDHDFDEICFFNFRGSKVRWNREAAGAVGRLSTDGLEIALNEFEGLLGPGKNAKELITLFKKSYLEHHNLTKATRYLANELFGEKGLVIVDGDDRELKRLFAPKVKEELLDRSCFSAVSGTSDALANNYHIQVNPREINLFYLTDELRERIVFEGGIYRVNQTDITFSEESILKELEDHPERFSPNALMRPLYQEVILPNLSYTGGGGELAYWMQMKQYFEKVDVPFPILHLRNSALLVYKKELRKMEKLGIEVKDIFLDQNELISNQVKQVSDIKIDFSPERRMLEEMFESMKGLAEKTDKSFIGAVLAQEKKQLNGLDKLEKRMLRAQKRKYADRVNRITEIQNLLFPKGSLQERQANFSEFYEEMGEGLIDLILERLDPMKMEFDIILLPS